jgi:hypothetical protein
MGFKKKMVGKANELHFILACKASATLHMLTM